MSENRASLSQSELKSALYNHIRDKGVLRTLKGQLRSELLSSAPAVMPKLAAATASSSRRAPAAAAAAQDTSLVSAGDGESPSVSSDVLCDSLVENYLRVRRYPATRTVFLGESGASAGGRASDDDLSAMLHLTPKNAAHSSPSSSSSAPASSSCALIVGAPQQHQQQQQQQRQVAVLTQLIREHLHHGGGVQSYTTTDCGVQVQLADPSSGSASKQAHHQHGFESIEYKLSLVDQSFVRARQTLDSDTKAAAEMRFSRMRDEVRADCAREARRELELWKEHEGAAIRREERERAAQQMADQLREFAAAEHKLLRKAADDVAAIEHLKRQSDRQLLVVQEECNDLKRAVYLRQQAQQVAEQETDKVRTELRAAQSHCEKLGAEIDYLKHSLELAQASESRRVEAKEHEIMSLLSQVRQQQDQMEQLRFDGRALAAECAHTLDEAARGAAHQRQVEAKDRLIAATAATTAAASPAVTSRSSFSTRPSAAAMTTTTTTTISGKQGRHVDPAETSSSQRIRRERAKPAVAAVEQSSDSGETSTSSTDRTSRLRSPTQNEEAARVVQQKPAVQPVAVAVPAPAVQASSKPPQQPLAQAQQPQHQVAETATPSIKKELPSRDSPDDSFEASSTESSPTVAVKADAAAAAKQKREEEEEEEGALAAAADREKHQQQKKEKEEEEASRLKKQQQEEAVAQAHAAAQAAEHEQKLARIQSSIDDLMKACDRVKCAGAVDEEAAARRVLVESEAAARAVARSTQQRREAAAEQAAKQLVRQHVAQCETDCEAEKESDFADYLQKWKDIWWQFDNGRTLIIAREKKDDDDYGAQPPAPRAISPSISSSDNGSDVDIFGRNDDEDF